MNKKQKQLLSFQRRTLAYERLFLSFIRKFLKDNQEEIISLATKGNWEGIDELVLKLYPDIVKRFRVIFEEFGNQELESLK